MKFDTNLERWTDFTHSSDEKNTAPNRTGGPDGLVVSGWNRPCGLTEVIESHHNSEPWATPIKNFSTARATPFCFGTVRRHGTETY